jgi:hypothetical protein
MKPSAILGLIAVLAAGYYVRSRFTSVISAATTPTSSCLEMTGSTTTEDGGATYITGSFKNNCGHSIGHVTVLFKLDQTPGTFSVGSVYAYSNDVKADETREFKSAMPVARDANFRFDGFNAF